VIHSMGKSKWDEMAAATITQSDSGTFSPRASLHFSSS
jgi:hypothetical protein